MRTALAGWRLRQPLSRLVASATPSGQALLIGGLLPGDDTVAGIERVDLRTGVAKSAPPLVTGVHDAAIASTATGALVFGGGAASEVSSVQQVAFDGGPTHVVGRLPQPRSDVTAVTSAATTYLVGGYDGSRQLASVLATRDGRRFTTVADLALAVRYTAAAVADGALWVFGGEHDGVAVDTIQRIDLRTRQVSRAGRLPQPLGDAVAVTLAGRVLLAGGRDGARVSRTVWEFDPRTVTFRRVARLPVAVGMPGVAVVGDTAWLFGGETAGAHTTAVQTISMH